MARTVTRTDPELGTVKRCRACREWWPDEGEFYKQNAATCKACKADLANSRPIPLSVVTHGSTADRTEKRRRDCERKAELRADPVLGDKLRARQRAAQRRHYVKNADAVRERNRQRYARNLDRPVREGFGRPRVAA